MPGRLLSVVDTLADRAVPIGYSWLGYRLRRPGWNLADPAPDACRDRVVLVTGANSGIGKAIVTGLARLGATVVLVVRDSERGEQTRTEILREHPAADLTVRVCDVSDLHDVRRFAAELGRRNPTIDVLIHNAGTLPTRRATTPQGHEMTLATHVFGPLLLTELLRQALAAAADPRVILVSSGGMYTQRLPTADPEYRENRYRGASAYARTKRMQVALLPALAQRYAANGVAVYGMHPGWVDTPGVTESLPRFHRLLRPFLRTTEQGADTVVWLAATHPPRPSGTFWHDRRPRPVHYVPTTRDTPAERERLWDYCVHTIPLDNHRDR